MKYIIDIAMMNKDNIHEYLKDVFNFNDRYGNNLDAFNDKISELNKCQISIINVSLSDDYQKKIINIIIMNALDNHDIRVDIKL